MENLQDMLLEHVVPDQVGQVGKVQYSFTEMKIVHVHWPKVTNVDSMFVANNGALRLQGKYDIHRTGVLGYHKSGEFIFDLGAICLSIKDNTNSDSRSTSPTPSTSRPRHQRHTRHQERHRTPQQDVTCTVGHIKVKFHGGAARLCQFLTSMYIKVYRRHLEAQIARVIQETVQEDGRVLMSALTVMATMNGIGSNGTSTTGTQLPSTSGHTAVERTSSDGSSSTGGRFQRFLGSFSRTTEPNT